MCVLARIGDFLLLKCISLSLCQSVNNSSELHQQTAASTTKKKFRNNKRKKPELVKDGEGSSSTAVLAPESIFSIPFNTSVFFYSPLFLFKALPSQHNCLQQALPGLGLDTEEQEPLCITLLTPPISL
jgi:hypothetical protein